MKIRKIDTRFMKGNIDLDCEIISIMIDKYGMKEVILSDFNFDNAIYSDGFIDAVKVGMIPVLGSETKSHLPKNEKEYHHVIVNNECYVMYFE